MAKCNKVKVEVVKKVDEDRYVLELSPSEAALIKFLVGGVSMIGCQDHHQIYRAIDMSEDDCFVHGRHSIPLKRHDYYDKAED